jgi:hypothetical protein
MRNKRFLIMASPHGHLTVRRADWFRLHPTDHVRKWQVLTYVRPPAGANLDRLLAEAYRDLVRLYEL